MRPLALQLYRLGTGMLAPFAPALLRTRARAGKENPARLSERLGYPGKARPDGALVWLHGASVGESLSLLPLIEALMDARPDLAILVTSGTVTSAELMADRLPAGAVHQFAPIDTLGAAARFLRHWQPGLAIFVESEIWPNLILEAQSQGCKLALVSARLSAGSLKGWARVPTAAKAVFGAFDRVMAQDQATALALTALGGRDDGRLNLKRFAAPPPVSPSELALLHQAAGGRPVLLAASTHPGEDEAVLDAFRGATASGVLVIVPRHPARGVEIERLAAEATFDTGLRSRGDPFGASTVYIADTLGELGLWFSLASAAFIGGSLVQEPGGHNPVEAALLGCPVVSGPHLDNWRDIYGELSQADAAVLVADAGALAATLRDAVENPMAAQARAARARQVVAADRATLNLAVRDLITLL